ncbi:hypothetical protein DFJ77DRAFT_439381 [Powellomyces hirtus]|nr:hypothetical protein DFJ77DRAFT_439381 [Powellomyces hirtus]
MAPSRHLCQQGKEALERTATCGIDSKDWDLAVEPVLEVYLAKPNGLKDWLTQQILLEEEIPRAKLWPQHSSRPNSPIRGTRLRKTVVTEVFDPKIPAWPKIPYEHHMASMEGT